MNIHLVAKDELEAQGIRWIIESHLTGVELKTFHTNEDLVEALQRKVPDLVILDMDGWPQEEEVFAELWQQKKLRWLGISSERIFQTAYRGLRFRAEDVLFRPFSTTDLIKYIQQLRFQLRNEQRPLGRHEAADAYSIDYPDFFLTEKIHEQPVTMAAFLTPRADTLPLVYDALQRFPFTGKNKVFALSEFILCVQEAREDLSEYHTFLVRWKERMDEPVAIVMNTSSEKRPLKEIYKQTKELTELIFFEGYDIILAENEQVGWRPLDPFLTPLEQREWIEMLEKQDTKAIREWVENEFLMYQKPYPDPEMVRVRLTSLLAQIRRYMKSHNIQNAKWESAYHEVFRQIVRKPVVYQIVKELLAFTIDLLHGRDYLQEGPRTLVEKVKTLIESNYWDSQWNLAACAETLRINKSTLSRRFATESGKSFRETLHKVRIREAKKLLQESDLSLEEIARLTGYTHQTYFNAKFKQLEKKTPSAFRLGL